MDSVHLRTSDTYFPPGWILSLFITTVRRIKHMINKVVRNLAKKYPAVQEGVRTIMGGKVLDYEAKRIKRSGIEEGLKAGLAKGRAEGREEGQLENLILNLKNLMENLCVSADEAMRLLNVSETLKPKLRDLL